MKKGLLAFTCLAILLSVPACKDRKKEPSTKKIVTKTEKRVKPSKKQVEKTPKKVSQPVGKVHESTTGRAAKKVMGY